MKIFTPDLIQRLGSADPAVARAAEDEWEAALSRYENYINSIESQLPDPIRAFNNLLLHDAIVWSIVRRDNQLIMVLRKDIPPQDVVLLTYDLTEEPFVDENALAANCRGPVMDFQYDEFELISETDRQVYCQRILFGNGWEMRLRFTNVQVSLASPVYPHRDMVLVPVASAVAKSA
jgi:hypothetical protein